MGCAGLELLADGLKPLLMLSQAHSASYRLESVPNAPSFFITCQIQHCFTGNVLDCAGLELLADGLKPPAEAEPSARQSAAGAPLGVSSPGIAATVSHIRRSVSSRWQSGAGAEALERPGVHAPPMLMQVCCMGM